MRFPSGCEGEDGTTSRRWSGLVVDSPGEYVVCGCAGLAARNFSAPCDAADARRGSGKPGGSGNGAVVTIPDSYDSIADECYKVALL